MPDYTIDLLAEALNQFEKPVKNTKIALLGLSYKANVGDLRESPALEIRDKLIKKGAALEIYDRYFPELSTCKSLEEILEKCVAVLIATDHKEFKAIDSAVLKKHDIKLVIDGKNCLDKEEIQAAGIYYKGIGR